MNRSAFLAVLAVPLLASAETLTVASAVERALTAAPEVAIARASAEEAAASARAARATLRPEAVITTTPGYAVGLPAAVAGRVPAWAGVEVRQTLYDASARAQALAAGAATLAPEAALEVARRDVARVTLETYGLAWRGQSLVALARRRLETRTALLSQAKALEREGRLTQLDVDRVALDEARARQKLLQAEGERDLALLALKRLTGLAPDASVVLGEDPALSLSKRAGVFGAAPDSAAEIASAKSPATPSAERPATMTEAMADDPLLRALSREVEELKISARLASRWLQPVVVAAGQYQRLSRGTGFDRFYLSFEENSAVVGLSVAVPVLTGGRLQEAGRRARASLARAEGRRQAREAELAGLVSEAEVGLRNALAGRVVARQAEGVSEEALRVARLLEAEGRGEPGATEKASLAASDAAEELTRADHDLLLARTRSLAARGELLPTLGLR